MSLEFIYNIPILLLISRDYATSQVVEKATKILHFICMEKDRILVKLGKRITEVRKDKGISQEELAFKVNTARNYIGCIERGEKSPSIKILYKISRALKVKTKDLIDF